MENLELVPLIVRWLHVLAACLAIGTPLFVRFVLLPAMHKTLDPEAAARVRGAVNATWRLVVGIMIAVFILTGIYMFVFIVLPTNLGPYKAAYHALFGLKMLLALVVFFLASVLPGRAPAFEFLRKNLKASLTTLILLLLLILMFAIALHTLRDQAMAYQLHQATTQR